MDDPLGEVLSPDGKFLHPGKPTDAPLAWFIPAGGETARPIYFFSPVAFEGEFQIMTY